MCGLYLELESEGTHRVTGCSTVGGVGAVVDGGLELGFSEADGAGIVSIGASGKFRSSKRLAGAKSGRGTWGVDRSLASRWPERHPESSLRSIVGRASVNSARGGCQQIASSSSRSSASAAPRWR